MAKKSVEKESAKPAATKPTKDFRALVEKVVKLECDQIPIIFIHGFPRRIANSLI